MNIIPSLISVIVPVYKVEMYLEKCINSILAQTYPHIEIILIDDGSPDRCGEICDYYAEVNCNIKVIHQDNAGLSAARNAGLKIASGEFIAFIDSDDFIDCDMYQILYDKAVATASDIVECNFHHTFPNYEDTEIVKKYYDKKSLLCFGRCIVWNKIYRKSFLNRANIIFPQGYIYEDLEFYIKIIPHVNTYSYVDIAPYHYLQRYDSINNFSSERTIQILQILKNIMQYYKNNALYEEYEEVLEFLFIRILLCSSFLRMCKLEDKYTRELALTDNWTLLNDYFPNWKKNRILKDYKSIKKIYMTTLNKKTYAIYKNILVILFHVQRKIRR